MNTEINRELAWDDSIENDNEFELLPPGDYDFTVTDFKRERHMGSEKLTPCNKAVITLSMTGANGERGSVIHNLFLHSKCEGMLCAFFTGIGQRKKGERLKMNWGTVVGSTGKCKVGVRKYTNRNGEERESNEIKKFYEPAEEANNTPTFTPGSF